MHLSQPRRVCFHFPDESECAVVCVCVCACFYVFCVWMLWWSRLTDTVCVCVCVYIFVCSCYLLRGWSRVCSFMLWPRCGVCLGSVWTPCWMLYLPPTHSEVVVVLQWTKTSLGSRRQEPQTPAATPREPQLQEETTRTCRLHPIWYDWFCFCLFVCFVFLSSVMAETLRLFTERGLFNEWNPSYILLGLTDTGFFGADGVRELRYPIYQPISIYNILNVVIKYMWQRSNLTKLYSKISVHRTINTLILK